MTQKELSKALGVSAVTVCNWVKRGMPTDSVQSANVWRASVSVRPPGCRSKGKAEKVAQEKAAEHSRGIPADADMSLEAVLNRAKRSEYLASMAVEDANKKGQMELYKLLTDNHARAVKARLDAEEASIELAKNSGQLLTLDDATARWGGIAQRIRMLLDSLPKSVGARCNPADPDLAISALTDWVNNQALKALNE